MNTMAPHSALEIDYCQYSPTPPWVPYTMYKPIFRGLFYTLLNPYKEAGWCG